MLFSLLLQALSLLFPLLLDPFAVLASALLIFPLALFTLLAPPFLFFLSGLFSRFILFLLAPPALLLLGSLFTFSLAFFLQLLLSFSLALFPSSFGLLRPLLFGLAAALLFLGSCFRADILNAVFAHFWQALFLNQALQQSGDGAHDVCVDFIAFARAFYEFRCDAGVLGQQRWITVGFAVDKFFEGSLQFVFGRLEPGY